MGRCRPEAKERLVPFGAESKGIVRQCEGPPAAALHDGGQVSGYTGAAALRGSLPAAEWQIADRDYDTDWFSGALKNKG